MPTETQIQTVRWDWKRIVTAGTLVGLVLGVSVGFSAGLVFGVAIA